MLEPRSTYQENSFWFYAPNKVAPIAFAVLFLISGLIHGYQCIKYRSWKVTGFLPWSALLFVAGFILRTLAAFGYWDNLDVFIAGSVFLQAAPPVYEASNFLALGRILYYIPYHSPIHPGRVFTTFLAVSVVIEIITANGAVQAANMNNSQELQDLGKALIKAALLLQLALMASFVALASRFYYKCWKGGVLNRKVKAALHVLLISCLFITIRTIYRVVEFFTATTLDATDPEGISPVLKEEWFFWVFEGVVMFFNTSMLNYFHIMQYLPRSNKIYLAQDGVTEIEGPGFVDKRPFILTMVDPFDITGMVTGRGGHEKFWENDAAPKSGSSGSTPENMA